MRHDDDGLQSAAPATRNATHLQKTTQKYCACHTKRFSTRYQTGWNVIKCHACHAKRSHATRRLEPPRVIPFAELAIGTAIATSRERLRTIATVNARSSEHTLNAQTPRVKREPLLRIRKKERTFFSTVVRLLWGHTDAKSVHLFFLATVCLHVDAEQSARESFSAKTGIKGSCISDG